MDRIRETAAFRANVRAFGMGLALLGMAACAGSAPVRAVRAARYYAEGTRALERGETQDAIDALERAGGLMPNASEIQNHLGLAYWADGRKDAALRALEQAVDLDCENEAARGNLTRLRAGMDAAEHGVAREDDGQESRVLRDAAERSGSDGG